MQLGRIRLYKSLAPTRDTKWLVFRAEGQGVVKAIWRWQLICVKEEKLRRPLGVKNSISKNALREVYGIFKTAPPMPWNGEAMKDPGLE